MKAIQIETPGKISLVHIEKPIPKENEALVKICVAGICGSDIAAFRGTNGLVSYPRVIGHELVGEIVEIPEQNKRNLKVGDKIIVEPYLFCGQCYPCSLGRTNCCTSLNVLGVHVDGGISEYITHPADMLLKLPSDMDLSVAPIAEPLSIALHGLHRLKLSDGEHIAIFGAGAIGLLAAMTALQYGTIPIVIDVLDSRLELAEKLGVRHTVNIQRENLTDKIKKITKAQGCECAMEASGSNSAICSTLDVVSYAGRIALTGWPKKETMFPTDIITKKELDIYGARNSAREFEEAIDLIHTGKVNAKAILTKLVSLEDTSSVLQDIDQNPGNYLKVNILM